MAVRSGFIRTARGGVCLSSREIGTRPLRMRNARDSPRQDGCHADDPRTTARSRTARQGGPRSNASQTCTLRHDRGRPAGSGQHRRTRARLQPSRGARSSPSTPRRTSPTCTRSSAPTRPTRSPSSPTTPASRSRRAGRTSTRFNPDVAVLDQGRQHRRRRRGRDLDVRLRDLGRQPRQLPVQRLRPHRRGRLATSPRRYSVAPQRRDRSARGWPCRRRTSARARRPSTRTCRRGRHPSDLGRRRPGLRRPARRPVLRGPRRHLRPGRPAAVQRGAPHPARQRPSGQDDLAGFNVNSIAIQVPKSALTNDGQPVTAADAANAVIGVWAGASRHGPVRRRRGPGRAGSRSRAWATRSSTRSSSRSARRTRGTADGPADDAQYARRYLNPELAAIVNTVYPTLPDARTTERDRPRAHPGPGRPRREPDQRRRASTTCSG